MGAAIRFEKYRLPFTRMHGLDILIDTLRRNIWNAAICRRKEGGVSSLGRDVLKTGTHSVSTASGARRTILGLGFSVFFIIMAACGSPDYAPAAQSAPAAGAVSWDNTIKALSPASPGIDVLGEDSEGVSIDISNRAQGYIVAHYTGESAKAKLILRKDGEASLDYIFDLTRGGYDVLPLSGGSGTYQISVNENISGDRYAVVFADTFRADVADEFHAYLYPNQYVNFGPGSDSTIIAQQITASSPDVFAAVENIYNFVVENIAYDTVKAESASQGLMAGYLPDVDQTLATGSGICFDYAAASAAMLRSQGVPARLVIGYSGQAYHSWIDVHIEGRGSVNTIRFDGEAWVLLDPTYAAAYAAAGATALIGDGANYIPMYYY